MTDKNLQLEEYINQITLEMSQHTTSTFINLNKAKKKEIVLAICREAAKLSDPTEINIKEVAKTGKISVGSLYKYFEKRENMINYIIDLIREYIVQGMKYSLKELLKLPLNSAMYYYCIGSEIWSKEEKELTYFYYQAAYCGNDRLTRELVHPVAISFQSTVKELLKKAVESGEIELNSSLENCGAFTHRSLLAIADSLVYKNLQKYYFPTGFSREKLEEYIAAVINGISK